MWLVFFPFLNPIERYYHLSDTSFNNSLISIVWLCIYICHYRTNMNWILSWHLLSFLKARSMFQLSPMLSLIPYIFIQQCKYRLCPCIKEWNIFCNLTLFFMQIIFNRLEKMTPPKVSQEIEGDWYPCKKKMAEKLASWNTFHFIVCNMIWYNHRSLCKR